MEIDADEVPASEIKQKNLSVEAGANQTQKPFRARSKPSRLQSTMAVPSSQGLDSHEEKPYENLVKQSPKTTLSSK